MTRALLVSRLLAVLELVCLPSVSIAGDEYDNLFVVVPRGEGPRELLRLRY